LNSVDRNGLVTTLYGVFGKSVKVSIPFSQRACDMSIDDIDFSPRANNSLKRAGIFTIGEIIDLIADDGLLRIRNLGKKTQNEIKTRIMVFGYERLNENEKKCFFGNIIDKNKKIL
jgi:DNA-directed RNA polymerase subunit alpha